MLEVCPCWGASGRGVQPLAPRSAGHGPLKDANSMFPLKMAGRPLTTPGDPWARVWSSFDNGSTCKPKWGGGGYVALPRPPLVVLIGPSKDWSGLICTAVDKGIAATMR